MTQNNVPPVVSPTSDNGRQTDLTTVPSLSPPTSNNDRQLDVNVYKLDDLQTVMLRENNAGEIAKLIIKWFGIALLCSFVIVLAIVVAAIFLPNEVVTKLIPSMSVILEIVKIVGAIFSPLLAFILGYYFSLRNSK